MSNSPSPFRAVSSLWFYMPAANGQVQLIARREVEMMIVSAAMRDPDFRNLLIHDPRSAIEQKMSTRLPLSLTVEIIAERIGEIVFVLPARPDDGSWTELAPITDETLSHMASIRALEQRTHRLDEEIYVALVTRAWTDEHFRTQLLAQPKSTIESLHGVCFEPDTEIVAVAETSDRIFILLPSPEADEELVPGLGIANVNPIFVEVLKSHNASVLPTYYPACQATDKYLGCPQAACTFRP